MRGLQRRAPARQAAIHRTKIFDDCDLAELRDYIDWTPFFQSWDLHGRYPAILTDDVVGEAATNLFNDAQAMLDQMIDEKWLTAKAVIALAARDGDDIVVFTDETRSAERTRLHYAAPANGAQKWPR